MSVMASLEPLLGPGRRVDLQRAQRLGHDERVLRVRRNLHDRGRRDRRLRAGDGQRAGCPRARTAARSRARATCSGTCAPAGSCRIDAASGAPLTTDGSSEDRDRAVRLGAVAGSSVRELAACAGVAASAAHRRARHPRDRPARRRPRRGHRRRRRDLARAAAARASCRRAATSPASIDRVRLRRRKYQSSARIAARPGRAARSDRELEHRRRRVVRVVLVEQHRDRDAALPVRLDEPAIDHALALGRGNENGSSIVCPASGGAQCTASGARHARGEALVVRRVARRSRRRAAAADVDLRGELALDVEPLGRGRGPARWPRARGRSSPSGSRRGFSS